MTDTDPSEKRMHDTQRHDTRCCGLPCCTVMPEIMTGSATLLFLPLLLFGAGMVLCLLWLCIDSMTMDRRDEQVAFLRPCNDAILNKGDGSVILAGGLRQHDVNSSLVLQVMPRAATFGDIYGEGATFSDYKKRVREIYLCTSRYVPADEDDRICYNYPDGDPPRRIPIADNERCSAPLRCSDDDDDNDHNADGHHHHDHDHDDDDHGSAAHLVAKRYYGLPIRFSHSTFEDLFFSTADIPLIGSNVNLGESELYVKALLTGASEVLYFPIHKTLTFIP